MVSSKIENHIVKYLLNESTSGELDQLSQWIMEPKNQKKFQKYIQSHYKINETNGQETYGICIRGHTVIRSWI